MVNSPHNPVSHPPEDGASPAALLHRAWEMHLSRPEESFRLAETAHTQAMIAERVYLAAWARLTMALARWRWIGADPDSLEEDFADAGRLMHALGDERGIRLTELGAAVACFKRGEWAEALVFFEALVGRFDVNQLDADNFYPLFGLATSYVYCGNLAEGLRFGYAGLHLTQQLNLAAHQASMSLPLGVALMAVRDPEESAAIFERAELIAEKIDSTMLLKATRTNLSIVFRRMGRLAEAEERIRWVLGEAPGMIGAQQFAHFTAAELHVQQGRIDDAEAELARAIACAGPAPQPLDAAKIRFLSAMIASRRDQLTDAIAHFEAVVALLPTVPALRFSDRALVHEEFAAALAASGRFQEAYQAQLHSSREYLANVSVLNRVRQFSMQVRHEIGRVRAQLVEASQERRTLQHFNAELSLAIEKSTREAERFRDEATHDPLTGLVNRRYLDQALPSLIKLAQQSATPVAIAFIDLDRFKRVNDDFGHAMGDTVLRGFAEAALEQLRGSDIIGRYGGEEFVAAIIGCGPAAAEKRLDDLQHRVRHATFRCDGAELSGVTFTAGVAIYPEDGIELDQLMRRADERLYRAKEAGRQRVVADDTPRLYAR
ncbi:MAG: diguanylate cyclase [Betaproteobacteria bacterium]|nr:diguanylate cyclase [Betaproteobacteria bacterium]